MAHTHTSLKSALASAHFSFNLFFYLHRSLCVLKSINSVSVFSPVMPQSLFFLSIWFNQTSNIARQRFALSHSLSHVLAHAQSLTFTKLYGNTKGGNTEPLIPYERFTWKCMSRRIFCNRMKRIRKARHCGVNVQSAWNLDTFTKIGNSNCSAKMIKLLCFLP